MTADPPPADPFPRPHPAAVMANSVALVLALFAAAMLGGRGDSALYAAAAGDPDPAGWRLLTYVAPGEVGGRPGHPRTIVFAVRNDFIKLRTSGSMSVTTPFGWSAAGLTGSVEWSIGGGSFSSASLEVSAWVLLGLGLSSGATRLLLAAARRGAGGAVRGRDPASVAALLVGLGRAWVWPAAFVGAALLALPHPIFSAAPGERAAGFVTRNPFFGGVVPIPFEPGPDHGWPAVAVGLPGETPFFAVPAAALLAAPVLLSGVAVLRWRRTRGAA